MSESKRNSTKEFYSTDDQDFISKLQDDFFQNRINSMQRDNDAKGVYYDDIICLVHKDEEDVGCLNQMYYWDYIDELGSINNHLKIDSSYFGFISEYKHDHTNYMESMKETFDHGIRFRAMIMRELYYDNNNNIFEETKDQTDWSISIGEIVFNNNKELLIIVQHDAWHMIEFEWIDILIPAYILNDNPWSILFCDFYIRVQKLSYNCESFLQENNFKTFHRGDKFQRFTQFGERTRFCELHCDYLCSVTEWDIGQVPPIPVECDMCGGQFMDPTRNLIIRHTQTAVHCYKFGLCSQKKNDEELNDSPKPT